MKTDFDKFNHYVEEFARRLIEMVVETKDDLPFDDNQVLYEIVVDTLDSVGAEQLLARVKEKARMILTNQRGKRP
jgi:hypothetical protein